jgi:CHAT domain-containing protein
VRWCPTGLFTFLPIHAAGIYTEGAAISVSDYVMSSYVPTIGSLLRTLSGSPTAHPTCSTSLFEMMVVIQQGLPCAKKELQNIADHVLNQCLVKLGVPGAPATVDKVVSHLSAVSIAHFACHGEQNKKNPLESSPILEDGRLKITRIMHESTPNALLAFLCACETAMGDKDLPDEAMHLGATLLFAGFCGTVATMW